jgi:molybdopterin/thiamine biosynthesis adenylyltransferase
MTIPYEDIYLRNIGLLTKEQQQTIRNAKIAVAGVGGVGSYQAVSVVRFGIGALAIMDPGIFDEPDMNRQYGALVSTIGRNKAEVTGEMLRDMNPHLQVDVFTHGAASREEVEAFIEGADMVIDAIDYGGFHFKQMLHACARERGLFVLTGPIPGFGGTLQVFDPAGMTIEEFYGAPADPGQWPDFPIPMDRLAPADVIPEALNEFYRGERPYLSTNAASAQLVGGLVGMEAIMLLTGLRTQAKRITVPDYVYVDMLRQEYRIIRSTGTPDNKRK